MHSLPTFDLIILVAYIAGVVALGCWFVRTSGTPKEYMAAGGRLPAWAVGLSIFGTYLSSITFLAVPGIAFATDWTPFVFSLSLPVAAFLAVKYFVPFYRSTGEISAYHHFEHRFGAWARTYAVICYLLTQFARTGSILFGVALALLALTGWNMVFIIVLTGALVTIYTLLGGIEAVIWTDVVQSIVLIAGALIILLVLLFGLPGGPAQMFEIGWENEKFLNANSLRLDLTSSTVWVVLLYGIFINLNNFGIDQNYVQRYHAARDEQQAAKSVWLGAMLYIPVSLSFFMIGTSLFAFYQTHPDYLQDVKQQVAHNQLKQQFGASNIAASDPEVQKLAETLKVADIGDHVFPHFIVFSPPPGVAGLLIAAILAAAMSSISTSLNSSATVILSDLYKRYARPQAGERESMRVLYGCTLLIGVAGTGIGVAMIGVRSFLDAWWTLAGIFAGGMLGLFLLGMVSRRAGPAAALAGVICGLIVIFWMTFSPQMEDLQPELKNPLHRYMITVVGTLTIFFVGLLVTWFLNRRIDGNNGMKAESM